jgi:hypothetical protein
MSVSTYIGSLHENLADVAWRVQHLPNMVTIVVWIDDRARVYAAAVDNAPELDASMLIGSYAPNRMADVIQDDLRAMLRDRAKDFMADS